MLDEWMGEMTTDKYNWLKTMVITIISITLTVILIAFTLAPITFIVNNILIILTMHYAYKKLFVRL